MNDKERINILRDAIEHVQDNLTQESPENFEHEISHLQYAMDQTE